MCQHRHKLYHLQQETTIPAEGGNTTTQASQSAVDYDSDAAVVSGAMGLVRVGGCGTKEANGTYEGNVYDGSFSQSSQWQEKKFCLVFTREMVTGAFVYSRGLGKQRQYI